MLSKQAKENFLAREFEGFDWIKQASDKELDNAIRLLYPKPDFIGTPWTHQKACFYLGVTLENFLFFCDMGLGKSRITIDILSYWKKANRLKAALILVPNVVNIESWATEFKKYSTHLTVIPLTGNKAQREAGLLDYGDVYVINYAGLQALTTEIVKRGKAKKGKRLVRDSAIKMFQKRFNAIVLDESTYAKNHNSLTYRICNAIAKKCEFRYALTGTPFGRDPIDLWSQFYIVDRGETLGKTLGIFRECLFSEKRNYWGGYEYTFQKKMEPKLRDWMKNRSIRYDETECQDLPEKIYTQVVVKFPESLETYYKKSLADIVAAQGNYQLMENAFIRMRQITSGFLGMRNEENTRIEIEFDDNPKLDALLELIEEMPLESKMVVFHEFIHTGKVISQALTDAKIPHESLWSGTKDRKAGLNRFLQDLKCRIFVVNSKSGGIGLNLQVANYCVFMESPVSPIVRKQAEKRCHRPGQTKKVFYYDLVISNSVDMQIIAYLQEGEDLFQALLESKENLR